MDKVELFNKVAMNAKVGSALEYNPITTLDTEWWQTNLDSLDIIVTKVSLCDVYGISDEEAKKVDIPKNVKELFDYLEANKTKDPQSVDEAIKEVVWL